MVVLDHTWLGRQWRLVVREHAELIILAVLIALAVINNSVMGEDGERAALDRVRNSNGYLIRYGQEN